MEKLKGEGKTKLVRRTRVRHECIHCCEPAVYRNTYLNDGVMGARRNPRSSAFGRDDCSWCSDYEEFLCADCQTKSKGASVPEGFGANATFFADKSPHLFLRWDEQEIEDTQT